MEYLVARSYVAKEDERAYTLEYYVFAEATPQNKILYGLVIAQTGEEEAYSKTIPWMEDKDEAVCLADTYAKNFVFPSLLPYLLEDLGIKRTE